MQAVALRAQPPATLLQPASPSSFLRPCPQAQSKKVAELGPAGPADQLRLLLSNVQLIAAIFYSLNSPGLTDVSRERGCPGFS